MKQTSNIYHNRSSKEEQVERASERRTGLKIVTFWMYMDPKII